MTFEIDMGATGYLEGINLWRIVGAEIKTAGTGSKMLALKMRNGQDELQANVMLGGNGWRAFGRRQMLGLGMPEDFKGVLDPAAFIGKLMWVATAVKHGTYEGKPTVRLEVDLGQLKFAGYQPANDPPPGFTAPPADVDETPF